MAGAKEERLLKAGQRERESLELVLSGATVSGKSSPSKFNEIIA